MRGRQRVVLLCLLFLAILPLQAEEISVGGRILDSRGKPLAKASIELLPKLKSFDAARLALQGKVSPDPSATSVTDADGRFEIKAPGPGMWRLRARAHGFVPVEASLQPLLEPAELPALRLEKDVPLAVTVLDPEGRPVAGARVAGWEDFSISQLPRYFVPLPWEGRPRFAVTGEDGTALLERREGENLLVSAGVPGLLASPGQKPGRASALQVRLARGCDRTLEVLDALLRPQPEVLVSTESQILGLTDASGRLTAAFPCEKRDLRLTFQAHDGRFLEGTLKRPSPEESAAPRFTLPRQPAVAAGLVLEAGSRTPIPGALVWSADPAAFVLTDAKGRYEVVLQRQNKTFLSAVAPRHVSSRAQLTGEPAAGPTLLLQPAVEVAGAVVDESGQPVSGAEVLAAPGPTSSPLRVVYNSPPRTRSGAQGRFRLTLATGQAFDLAVSHDGFAPYRQELAELKASRKDMKIVLQRGRKASGKVVDEQEQPVAGATVILRKVEAGGGPPRAGTEPYPDFTATADAQGSFMLDHLPAGSFDLRASAAGFASALVRGLPIPEGTGSTPLGTVILRPGVAIEGIVVDPQGRPVAEASVKAKGREEIPYWLALPGEGARQVTTGADGRFTLGDLTPGERLELSASREGFADRSVPGIEAPTAQPLRIVLSPASKVSGRVLDDKGDPVTAAMLTFFRPREMRLPGRPGDEVASSFSDPEGRFTAAGIEPGKLAIRAESPGFLSKELDNLEVLAGQDLENVEIVLRPGAVVAGRVFGPDGAPVAGARITVLENKGMFLFSSSDGDGNYRLGSVPEGPLSVVAEHPDHRRTVRDLDVQPGDNRLDLRFESGSEVEGRVVDAAGRPVASARLWLRPSGSFRPQSASSAADGSFRFSGVGTGMYRIDAEKEGYATGRLDDIRVARSVSGLELRLESGGVIRGTITGLDFSEMSQVEIAAMGTEPMEGKFGRVDYKGEYRIENVPAGEWNVTARAGNGRNAQGRVTLEPGAAEAVLDLELSGGLVLSGRVVRGGEPLSGVSVQAWSRDKPKSGSGTTNQEGAFRIDGLEAGTYTVNIGEYRRGIRHDETVELTADREILIEVPESRLSGRVVDAADSSPLKDVTVSLETVGGEPSSSGRSTTDSEGLFTLSSLDDGSYRVIARKDGYAPSEASVQIGMEGGSDYLRLALTATEGLTVQVLGPAGTPPEEVHYALVDAGGRSVLTGRELTGEAGRLRISSAPPGSWRLLLSAPGTATAALEVQVPSTQLRVVLPPVAPLKVTVPDLADSSLPATLSVQGSDGRPYTALIWGSVTREWGFAEGQMILDFLPPGSWKLTVTAQDGRTWQETATTIPGRQSEVVVR